jgi:hypothetical protein
MRTTYIYIYIYIHTYIAHVHTYIAYTHIYSIIAADVPSSAVSSKICTPLGSKLGAKSVVNEQRMFLLQPMPHTSADVSIREHT